MLEVGQFVDHDVFQNFLRREHEGPVDADGARLWIARGLD